MVEFECPQSKRIFESSLFTHKNSRHTACIRDHFFNHAVSPPLQTLLTLLNSAIFYNLILLTENTYTVSDNLTILSPVNVF